MIIYQYILIYYIIILYIKYIYKLKTIYIYIHSSSLKMVQLNDFSA
jgi:hypothetical protein